jgi:hypothetical protein
MSLNTKNDKNRPKNLINLTKKKFFHINFEVAHSAHSGLSAQNSMRLLLYSWAPTISTILDRNPRGTPEKVPLLVKPRTPKKS